MPTHTKKTNENTQIVLSDVTRRVLIEAALNTDWATNPHVGSKMGRTINQLAGDYDEDGGLTEPEGFDIRNGGDAIKVGKQIRYLLGSLETAIQQVNPDTVRKFVYAERNGDLIHGLQAIDPKLMADAITELEYQCSAAYVPLRFKNDWSPYKPTNNGNHHSSGSPTHYNGKY